MREYTIHPIDTMNFGDLLIRRRNAITSFLQDNEYIVLENDKITELIEVLMQLNVKETE